MSINFKRLTKEYKDFQKNSEILQKKITLEPLNKKLTSWTAAIEGPPDSPYEKGKFILSIEMPSDYPFKPPNIHFKTKIFHPNISSSDGSVCVDILKSGWSPALTLDKVLLSIGLLLECPNPDDPLNGEAGRLLKKNKDEYDATVRKYIENYCK